MAGRDTRSRFQGVYARHEQDCAKSTNRDAACDCKPAYFGVVWDKAAGRTRKTRHHRTAVEARNARADLAASIREGKPIGSSSIRLDAAAEKFATAAADGIVRNKHGRRYRGTAVADLRSSLAKVPDKLQARRLDDITRGDVQRMVDDFHGENLSGSRIRSVVNALRSLYRWAEEREFTSGNPAAEIRLPAMDSTPRDRVATPAEFAELLTALQAADQVPFALAAYGSARAAGIRGVEWADVDFERRALRLTEKGKTRVVPIVAPLLAILRAEHLRQGRPKAGRVCRPQRASKSGELATGQLLKRARKAWIDANEAEAKRAKRDGRKPAPMTPIGLHECRHTCATWLDHAGVSPRVVSEWMGHATPDAQPGAAAITLSRYTHVLPDALERARERLDAFLRQGAQLREVR